MDLLLKKLRGFLILVIDARLAVFYAILKVVLNFADIILHDSLHNVKRQLTLLHALRRLFKWNCVVKVGQFILNKLLVVQAVDQFLVRDIFNDFLRLNFEGLAPILKALAKHLI